MVRFYSLLDKSVASRKYLGNTYLLKLSFSIDLFKLIRQERIDVAWFIMSVHIIMDSINDYFLIKMTNKWAQKLIDKSNKI